MDITATLPIFIVTLREGFEAALVVGIVLAYLKQAQQTQLYRWVWQGMSGGIVASVLVGFLLAGVLQGVAHQTNPYTPILKALLAALFGAIAVGMLSWMLIWMTQQSRSLKADIQGEIASALTQADGGKAVAVVVFIAVLREGFETVFFLAAQEQVTNLGGIVAALLGILAAILLAYLIFQVGVKVNLKRFFQILGTLLFLIVAGLVIGVLKNLDLAATLMGQADLGLQGVCFVPGDSCLLGPQLWDLSQWLPDRQFPGLILKTLLGYRDHFYLLQGITYVGFLGFIGRLYYQGLQSPVSPSAKVDRPITP
ncbi:MAG: FTR1 family protein [Synechocystis sp.]|nr:FTR1 family protein [Synechocystis sp.]